MTIVFIVIVAGIDYYCCGIVFGVNCIIDDDNLNCYCY